MGIIKLNGSQLTQLLFNKKCLLCNGDVVLNVEFDKPSLLIIFHTNCKICNNYLRSLLPCKSIEQLEWAQSEIAKSTFDNKGYISGWGAGKIE